MAPRTLSIINLTIAAFTLVLGITKAFAARQEPGPTLKLTSSVLLHSAVIFLLATPPLYRATGNLLHAPNIAALGIDIATLLCVGHAHYMTLLWHPQRHSPDARRRAVRAWAPFYIGTITLMVLLYAYADLKGAAPPLHFAPYYARVPSVVALKAVYFTALTVAVLATMGLCRKVVLPDRPDLARSVRTCISWFTVAVGLDLATAAFTLSSMAGAVFRDDHHLDVLADASWIATILSGIAANQSLGWLVVATTRSDRRDCRRLKPLWTLVVAEAPHLVIPTPWWGDSRIRLDRMMLEVLDGMRILTPWMSSHPGRVVEDLATQQRQAGEVDIQAAQAAAVLRHAAALRRAGEPGPRSERTTLPGSDVPEDEQQAYLLVVARYLDHPLVNEALKGLTARPHTLENR
ncbi:MAB_1171c family putative transporter [Streptomyces griseoviridis]|uniref:MAB_1171c family putative transporter n=1 Tax=Streptomyces griseoviridis TaxID=45398 RepID=UPI0033F6EFB8